MSKRIIKRIFLTALVRKYNEHNTTVGLVVNRILVVRLDEIGDMVLMSPFLRELRRLYPVSEITLVVKPAVYNLVELCPYVDNIKVFYRPAQGRGMFCRILWAAKRFVKKEFVGVYDLAIVPRFDADASYGAGFIAFFSGAQRRIGFSSDVVPLKSISDEGYDGLYTEFIPPRAGIIHEVERNLDVIRYLGGNIEDSSIEIWTNAQDEIKAKNLLRSIASSGIVLRLVVLLSAGWRRKEWDVKKFIEVVKCLQKLFPIEPILLGAGEPAKTYGEIFENEISGTINLINQCTLRQTYEVMKQSQFVLGCDTGPMHIAAAAGLSGVALFLGNHEWSKDGLDTPERFAPWTSKIKIIQPNKVLEGCEFGCRKDYSHCINQISVDEVVDVLKEIIIRWKMSPNSI